MALFLYLFIICIQILNSSILLLPQLSLFIIWSSIFITSFIYIIIYYKNLFAIEKIELYMLSNIFLPFIIFIKIIKFWIIYIAPLILITPFLFFIFSIPIFENTTIFIHLIFSSLSILLVGILTISLTYNYYLKFIYLFFLLPLSIPILILKSLIITNSLLIIYFIITPILCSHIFYNGLINK